MNWCMWLVEACVCTRGSVHLSWSVHTACEVSASRRVGGGQRDSKAAASVSPASSQIPAWQKGAARGRSDPPLLTTTPPTPPPPPPSPTPHSPTLTRFGGSSRPTGSVRPPSQLPARGSQRPPPASPQSCRPHAGVLPGLPGLLPAAARGWGPPLGQTPPFCGVPAPALALPSLPSLPAGAPSRLRSRGADIAAAARSVLRRRERRASRAVLSGSRPRAARGGAGGGMAGGRAAGPG